MTQQAAYWTSYTCYIILIQFIGITDKYVKEKYIYHYLVYEESFNFIKTTNIILLSCNLTRISLEFIIL